MTTETTSGGRGTWLGIPCEDHPGVYLRTAAALADGFEPPHYVHDLDKVEYLMESIVWEGWRGAPLVADARSDQLLTGSHRWAAVRNLAVDRPERTRAALVPLIDVRDVFAEAGMDLSDVQRAYGQDRDFWSEDAERYEYERVLLELPVAVRQKYGIDAQIQP